MLSRAELVICRGGGTTLAELAAAGVPAIVCPFIRAADDHQRRNAEVFAAAGACHLVGARSSSEPLSVQLSVALSELLDDVRQRPAMAAAMLGLARPAASEGSRALPAE